MVEQRCYEVSQEYSNINSEIIISKKLTQLRSLGEKFNLPYTKKPYS